MLADILTLGRNFGPWFAAVALAAFLGGNYTGHLMTKGFYVGRAERAERLLAEYKLDVTEAITKESNRQIDIQSEIRNAKDEQQKLLDSIHSDLLAISRDARVCASTSTMHIPATSQGIVAPTDTGQPRSADEVLQELATYIATRADSNANEHNALVDWVIKTYQMRSD